jgi:1-acyl-sn-glycerol-3-phosphate acyltransferase
MQFNSLANTNILKQRKESPLQKFLRRFHIVWAGAWWLIGFFVLFPFFCLCIWFRRIEHWMAFFNQLWCYLFFPMALLRVKTVGLENIPKGPIIYVSNHGSFLDIPLLTYILPGFPAFMGKASLGRIPVFGFMFRNLHVVVERGSREGRLKALKASRRKLAKGRSLVIFPEGSIHLDIQPGLAEMKDGAFKLAIQKKVPIVPISICFNWFILPDDERWLPNFYYCKSVIHPPIYTENLTDSDAESLKSQVADVIAGTLAKENEALIKKIKNEN